MRRWARKAAGRRRGSGGRSPVRDPGTVHVRDSKNVEGPRLALTPRAWADFLPCTAESR
ncbi:DUF397 domain-containing protein [Streptomyces sp. D2-8]|uniref:DUF397 domain-containing protein n=1 Tax=Streptomyces sp. D2-8 TaxID=2707767 RepID=UPI0035AE2F8C